MYNWLVVGWVLSLALVIDCAKNRRDLTWFFILFLPFGSLAYLVYFWESITFPFPVARTLRSLTGRRSQSKRCSRCHQLTPTLEPFEDGRTIHFLCSMCRSELELTRKLS